MAQNGNNEKAKAGDLRAAAEKSTKKSRLILAIFISAVVLIVAFLIVLTNVIIPSNKYGSATMLYDSGSFEEALSVFKELNGYKDSEEYVARCETAINDRNYDRAIALLEEGRYDEALSAFKALNGYKDSVQQIKECEAIINEQRYNDALSLAEAGKYEEAISAFRELDGYGDSAEQIAKCEAAINEINYGDALSLAEAGKYEEAIAAFKALNGYKDSAEQAEKCELAIRDKRYDNAVSLAEAEKYDEAIAAFKALNGYKDSAEQIEKCYVGKYGEEKYGLVKNINVGDTYTFGSYEQDNDTSDGKEEIEWIVLEKDGMSLFLMSKYALDCRKYNETYSDHVTWEICTLREWLNDSFLTDAFSSDERELIEDSAVTAEANPAYGNTPPGNETVDKVFLLSAVDVSRYFKSNAERKCVPTEYAIERGAYTSTNNSLEGDATCWWWLRSPGDDSDSAASVRSGGSIIYYGNFVDSVFAVRPVIRIDLSNKQ